MTDDAPVTYQLKVSLIGISPMIWRRFRVDGNSTITDLHYILQLVMGWSNYHLNRFIILREREKFRYEYDFTDRWHHQLRVEAAWLKAG